MISISLRHWLRRLERHHAEALSFVDETTYRVWRLYLAGSAHGFRRGHIAVYQTLLANLDFVRPDQPASHTRRLVHAKFNCAKFHVI
jgi:cyclopropane-fatty-acyl-phospholipid synthase